MRNMDERGKTVREIFLENGQEWKVPIEREDWRYYDYEEKKVIRKRHKYGKLKNLLIERGYASEEAKEIIYECELRGIIKRVALGSNSGGEDDIYQMANEEDFVEEIVHTLAYHVFYMREQLGEEIKDYIIDAVFDKKDRDEIKLREVFAKQNKKELSETELIRYLKEKGYTDEEAEQLIRKYTQKEEERKIWRVEDIFRKPEYKPLKHYSRPVAKLDVVNDALITREKNEDFYEITEMEEWLLDEYDEILELRRDRKFIFGTDKVSFRTIKKILQEAWECGKKVLIHEELKQKIIEKCNVTEEAAEIAINMAFRTFKIRELSQTLEEIWGIEHTNELKYFWSGTTNEYPPLTIQDRVSNPLKEIFMKAKKQGKKTLTSDELIQEALKTYQKLKEERELTLIREVDREFIEALIEDAEALLRIKTKIENGEKRHSWSLHNQNIKKTFIPKKPRI